MGAVILAALVLPAGFVDPVASGFLLFLALLLGGLTSVGIHGNVTYALLSIAIGVPAALVLFHYSPATGLRAPTALSMREFAILIAIALSPALLLVAVGCIRRRR
jgi:hypothetical protein